MKIIHVKGSDHVYSSNVYLLLGDWKRIEDLNTLVDVGSDPAIVDTIAKLNTGVGKSKVEQVIITHNHSDHMAALPLIREAFHPKVFAFSPFIDGVDHILSDGDRIRVGDRTCEIIHTPGHSSDSLSLYIEEDGIIFVGDAPVVIRSVGGAYEQNFVDALERISKKSIRKIYFGHGDPVLQNAGEILSESLKNVEQSVRAQILESRNTQAGGPDDSRRVDVPADRRVRKGGL